MSFLVGLTGSRVRRSMPHPEMELEHVFQQGVKAAFYPIYPSSEKLINKGVSQRVIQKLVASLLQNKEAVFSETLPSIFIRPL
jgi:ATP-dependent DNA helicase RecG